MVEGALVCLFFVRGRRHTSLAVSRGASDACSPAVVMYTYLCACGKLHEPSTRRWPTHTRLLCYTPHGVLRPWSATQKTVVGSSGGRNPPAPSTRLTRDYCILFGSFRGSCNLGSTCVSIHMIASLCRVQFLSDSSAIKCRMAVTKMAYHTFSSEIYSHRFSE